MHIVVDRNTQDIEDGVVTEGGPITLPGGGTLHIDSADNVEILSILPIPNSAVSIDVIRRGEVAERLSSTENLRLVDYEVPAGQSRTLQNNGTDVTVGWSLHD